MIRAAAVRRSPKCHGLRRRGLQGCTIREQSYPSTYRNRHAKSQTSPSDGEYRAGIRCAAKGQTLGDTEIVSAIEAARPNESARTK
jgi:hypothetical protein